MRKNMQFTIFILALALFQWWSCSTNPTQSEDKFPFEVKWKIENTLSSFFPPSIGPDGTLYLVSYIQEGDGGKTTLLAISKDGKIKWKYDKRSVLGINTPVIGLNGDIYFTRQGDLLALNSSNGSLKFRFTNPQGSYTATWFPAIGSDGTIYYGSGKYLYALTPEGNMKWKFSAPTRYFAVYGPVIDNSGTIYFGAYDSLMASSESYLYALNPDGSLKWRYTAESRFTSHPALDINANRIYIGTIENGLNAIDLSTGTFLWANSTMYRLRDKEINLYGIAPVVGKDGTIYAIDYFLIAFSPESGKQKWNKSPVKGNSPILTASGHIIVSGGIDLEIYNPQGELVEKITYDGEGGFNTFSNIALGPDGTLYCIIDKTFYAFKTNYGGLAKVPWPQIGFNLARQSNVGLSLQ
ncbi:MAG: PQQ-like beta-propeller repeat protein [Calditrichaeota bacterium]|nr:PQQ-like beta-propeller repeat protein [Calditrichota bacterium]